MRAFPFGRVYLRVPLFGMVVRAPVCRSREIASPPVPYCGVSRAWLPSPDQSAMFGARSPAGKSVIEYRSPAGLTRYNTSVAVSGVGSPGGGGLPGLCGVTGVHTASIHPGPTCAQGTSPMPRSAPCATAGFAARVVPGADLAADVAELPGLDWVAVEFDDDEQPAKSSDADANMPSPARQTATWVKTCFITVPFTTMGDAVVSRGSGQSPSGRNVERCRSTRMPRWPDKCGRRP